MPNPEKRKGGHVGSDTTEGDRKRDLVVIRLFDAPLERVFVQSRGHQDGNVRHGIRLQIGSHADPVQERLGAVFGQDG
jgi:hypothetical protein